MGILADMLPRPDLDKTYSKHEVIMAIRGAWRETEQAIKDVLPRVGFQQRVGLERELEDLKYLQAELFRRLRIQGGPYG